MSERISRPIWLNEASGKVDIIDQRKLPHALSIVGLDTPEDVVTAIREMYVRGAPLIGVTGAYGIYLAALTWARGAARRPSSWPGTESGRPVPRR